MEISEQIIAVLDNLAQKFGVAVDWGSANVIPYLQSVAHKYIVWEIATSLMWIAAALLGVGFGIWLKKRVKEIKTDIANAKAEKNGELDKDERKEYEFREDCAYMGNFFAFVVFVVAFLIICNQMADIIKCLAFPELQVIDYLALLAGKMQ